MTSGDRHHKRAERNATRIHRKRQSGRWIKKQIATIHLGAAKLARVIDPILFVGLLILVLWLPIPLGSNRDWAKAIFELWISGLAVLQILVVLLKREQAPPSSHAVIFIFILWGLWLGWIAMQTLNLPAEWMQILSPHRYGVEMQARNLLGQAPSQSVAISLDRSVTVAKLYESFAYVLFFGLVLINSRQSLGRRTLFLGTLLASGCLQVAYSIYLNTSGLSADPLVGKPINPNSVSGTFINRNHFAGYLELSLAAGLGLLGAWPPAASMLSGWKLHLSKVVGALDPRILWSRIAIAVLFAGLFLSQSRMGNTAALSGLIVGMIASFTKATRNKSWVGALIFIISIFVFDITFIGSQYGGDRLAARMQTAVTDYTVDDRALIRPDLDHMVREFWLSGSGLGSFATAYPEFRTVGGTNSIQHAHNDYYQFFIEVGVVGVVALGAIVLLTLIQSVRLLWRVKEPKIRAVAITAICAIVSMGVHSTVDFNLQIACNALTFIGILALVWSCPLPPPTRLKVIKRRENKGLEVDKTVVSEPDLIREFPNAHSKFQKSGQK